MKRLISIEDFFKLVKSKSNLVILDCRFDLMDKEYGINSYKKGHIKGAYLLNIEKDLVDPVGIHGGRHPFKNKNELIEILKEFGIDNDTTIITYDDGDMQGAGRLVFQLNNLGVKSAYALDGGIFAYKNHGGEIEINANIPKASTKNLDLNIDQSFIVDMEYVKSKLYDENIILVDSRANDRYQGLVEPVDFKMGHIPSAKSYFFMDVLNLDDMSSSSFKSDEELKKHFKDLDNNKEKILYCGSGISLMVNALALDKIGIEYKIYPGSFSDWISYPENEIKTGEE